MALTLTKTEGKEWIGVILSLIILIVALYIISKHYKNPGFWWGFGAMFLLATSITTGENSSFESPFLSINSNKK